MLKIFSTQLSGLFKRIMDNQSERMEDAGRLLAQALVSEGKIYLLCFGEMKAVVNEALLGAEPLKGIVVLEKMDELSRIEPMDRVLLVTRHSDDNEAVDAAKKLAEDGVPFVSVSAHRESVGNSLIDVADVSIDLELKNGLIPDDIGGRYGYPFSMAALFVYYGLKWTVEEIVAEYE